MEASLESQVPCGERVAVAPPEADKASPWDRLLGLARAKNTLALLDQAVVSGSNFLTTILIGRWCSAEELGVYSLGFSLLVTWACAQEALISLPYTIYRHRPQLGTPAEYAGSALIHQGMLSALALVVLALTAAALSLGGAVPGLAAVTWVLAAVTPFALLREFARRFAFAHLRMGEALALDVAVATAQLAGLGWLASTGTLSADTAFVVVGAACALSSAVWLYLGRDQFVRRWTGVGSTLRQSWALGKWLFASQVTLSVQGYFVHWLLAWSLGATATGVYVACLTVVLFSNPLILGISNALAPRAAQAFSEGGGAELRRVVFQTTLLVGAAMALFCAVVLVAGDDVMGLLYRGAQYEGHGHTVAVLALAMLAAALGMPASNGLAAVERPDVVFKVGLAAVALSLVLVPCLVFGWGVSGAAYGFLAGNVAGSLGRWLAFSALVRDAGRKQTRMHARARERPGAPLEQDTGGNDLRTRVIQVLGQFMPALGPRCWVIDQLSEGAQASLFAVRRQDGRPTWETDLELAVKLYRPAAWQDVTVARQQFESLARLHEKLGGQVIEGWRIGVPAPVYQCERPVALVMTVVPGRSLNACLQSAGEVPEALREPIARAIVAAMQRCWVDSLIHGDLNFDNILCDVAGQTLSFVDPGVVEPDFACEGVSKDWYPASRDLAYLLYDTGVGVKRTFANPGARRRQEDLAGRVLRAFLEGIASGEERLALLDEVHACVQVHLQRLRGSWAPRGLWHLLLRRIAARRIDALLDRSRAQAGAAP